MGRFYNVYSKDTIGETEFIQLKNLPATETGRKFFLSWSHYIKLMRIENVDERHFCEIEATKNISGFLQVNAKLFCQAKKSYKNS